MNVDTRPPSYYGDVCEVTRCPRCLSCLSCSRHADDCDES